MNSVQRDLLEQSIIDIWGSIDENMAAYVREATATLIAKGAPAISIRITSEGGNVDFGLDIYDMLRLYPAKKTGVVVGFAHSMATIILQACDWRQINKHSRFLIHFSSGNSPLNAAELKDKALLKRLIGSLENNNEIFLDIYQKRTGMDRKKLTEVMEKGLIIKSDKALSYHLVDEII